MAKKKFYRSELTVSCEPNARHKNLIGVLISIVVLIVISSMIVAAIVIINPDIVSKSGGPFTPREAITLEEAMLNELSGTSFVGQWLSSSSSSSQDGDSAGQQDELLYEDSKNFNINIMTMPPVDHQLASGANNNNDNNNSQQQQQQPALQGKGAAAATGRFAPKLANGFQPNVTVLISNKSLLSSIEYQGFKLSPSKRYLLIWTARKRQFRHSFTAKYFIYDIKQDLISLLSTARPEATSGDPQQAASSSAAASSSSFEHLDTATEYLNQRSDGDQFSRFQAVDWFQSPPSSSSSSSEASERDSLILIQNNDIYLLTNVGASSAANEGRRPPPIRLTHTGNQEAGIFNGIPDWLYEEEILADVAAFQVSPKGTSLAYMSFNDSQVDLMPFSVYGPGEQVIPRVQRVRYPKAGRVNPRVTVHLVDQLTAGAGSPLSADGGSAARAPAPLELQLPDELRTRQHYINRISWLGDDRLALIWLNRSQNESYVVLCARQAAWQCELNLRLSASGGWLEVGDEPVLLDEHHYLAILPKDEGDDVGKFKHLAKVSLQQPNSYSFLTGGRREVTGLLGFNRARKLLFYQSTIEDEPGQRQVFALSFDTTNQQPQPQRQRETICLTCELHPAGECLYNSASISHSGEYFILNCDGPGVPRTELRLTQTIVSTRRHLLPESVQRPATNSTFARRDQHQEATVLSAAGSGLDGGDQPGSARVEPAPSIRPEEVADRSLLWLIEDNRELREKLEFTKAMPLTMRLRVPIEGTNYSANVMLLLPPQLGGGSGRAAGPTSPTLGFGSSSGSVRWPAAAAASPAGGGGGGSWRTRRAASLGNSQTGLVRALHSYLTPDTIGDYTNQLSSGQQYPMVVDVYAGPNSQKVDYRFHIGFGHYLASNRRTIYAMIDGRGSGYQGTKRLYELYHRFGTVEIQDQIEVSAYLTRAYSSFIDPARVAIWGWSYGGYAAAMALAQSNARALHEFNAAAAAAKLKLNLHRLRAATSTTNHSSLDGEPKLQQSVSPPPPPAALNHHGGGGVFECAASVAPVTNWIYYDTAYTERYMSSPYLNHHYDNHRAADHWLASAVNHSSSSSAGAGAESTDTAGLSRLNQKSQANRWLPLSGAPSNGQPTSLAHHLAGLIRSPSSHEEGPQSSLFKSPMSSSSSSSLNSTAADLNEHYRRASLIEQIANIDRKRFLLIHGTADDNVHFQQSIFLMKRLIQKNVMFETRVYPDQDHGIANRADKLHLGSTLSNFFAECFDMAY